MFLLNYLVLSGNVFQYVIENITGVKLAHIGNVTCPGNQWIPSYKYLKVQKDHF